MNLPAFLANVPQLTVSPLVTLTQSLLSAAGSFSQPAITPIYVRIDPSWTFYNAWASNAVMTEFGIINYSYEQGIQEQQPVSYESETAAGRAEPYLTYQHTEGMSFTLPFALFAAGDDGETNIQRAIDKEVLAPYNFLNSLKQPWRLNGISMAPPPVLMTMGSFFSARGVITDFVGNAKDVFDPFTLTPHHIDCSITLQVVRKTMPGFYPRTRKFY